MFGLLAFQGLEIDQVCKDDAFRHRACLGDDVELFGVCRGYVGIDQYLFRSALSAGGGYCVVHDSLNAIFRMLCKAKTAKNRRWGKISVAISAIFRIMNSWIRR